MNSEPYAAYYGSKTHPGQAQLGPADDYGNSTYVEPETFARIQWEVERIVNEAYAKRGDSGKEDPIRHLVRLAVLIAFRGGRK